MIATRANELRNFFKASRVRSGLTQQAIADLAGVKQATVSAFENNPSAARFDTVMRLLSAAGLYLNVGERVSLAQQEVGQEEW